MCLLSGSSVAPNVRVGINYYASACSRRFLNTVARTRNAEWCVHVQRFLCVVVGALKTKHTLFVPSDINAHAQTQMQGKTLPNVRGFHYRFDGDNTRARAFASSNE